MISKDYLSLLALPEDFEKLLATMRSREISVSIVIQNVSQLKALFEKTWESVIGLCDELLYLGGNEQATHKMISEMIGKETLDIETHGKSTGQSGSYSTNYQLSARELILPEEVRRLDNELAVLFIRGESPLIDRKIDLFHHPNIGGTTFGKGEAYEHGIIDRAGAVIEVLTSRVLSEEEQEQLKHEGPLIEIMDDEEFETYLKEEKTLEKQENE